MYGGHRLIIFDIHDELHTRFKNTHTPLKEITNGHKSIVDYKFEMYLEASSINSQGTFCFGYTKEPSGKIYYSMFVSNLIYAPTTFLPRNRIRPCSDQESQYILDRIKSDDLLQKVDDTIHQFEIIL